MSNESESINPHNQPTACIEICEHLVVKLTKIKNR